MIDTVSQSRSTGGVLNVGGDIIPDTDGQRDLGSSGREFADLFIDGTANIDDLSVTGTASLTGPVDIGDSTSDTVTITAAIDSNLLPDSTGNERSLGSSVQKWHDLNLDNNANIGGITSVGTGITMHPHGGVAIAGITTIGGQLNCDGNIKVSGTVPHIELNDAADRDWETSSN